MKIIPFPRILDEERQLLIDCAMRYGLGGRAHDPAVSGS